MSKNKNLNNLVSTLSMTVANQTNATKVLISKMDDIRIISSSILSEIEKMNQEKVRPEPVVEVLSKLADGQKRIASNMESGQRFMNELIRKNGDNGRTYTGGELSPRHQKKEKGQVELKDPPREGSPKFSSKDKLRMLLHIREKYKKIPHPDSRAGRLFVLLNGVKGIITCPEMREIYNMKHVDDEVTDKQLYSSVHQLINANLAFVQNGESGAAYYCLSPKSRRFFKDGLAKDYMSLTS